MGETAVTQGAFHTILVYHDICDHDAVPHEVELAVHDYEHSCASHMCNDVEPGYDGTICPEDHDGHDHGGHDGHDHGGGMEEIACDDSGKALYDEHIVEITEGCAGILDGSVTECPVACSQPMGVLEHHYEGCTSRTPPALYNDVVATGKCLAGTT